MNDLTDTSLRRKAGSGDPAAQYRLAKAYFSQQRSLRGLRWLRFAVEGKAPQAMVDLALRHLTGAEVQLNIQVAYGMLAEASQLGSAEASYHLANLQAAGFGTEKNLPAALEHLQLAANADCPAALRTLGMLYALDQQANPGNRALATLLKAASLGDGIAAYFAARSLLHSESDRDHAQARYLLEQAVEQKIGLATRRLKAWSTTSTLPDAIAPEALWQSFNPLVIEPGWDTRREDRRQQVASEPRIYRIEGLLTALESEYVIAMAEPNMQVSMVTDTAGRPIKDPIRTSNSTNFLETVRDMAIHLIESRMIAVTGVPIAHAEPLGVLRYERGEEYKQHVDFLSQASLDSAFGQTGQRLQTIFTYLSDVAEGGETSFPEADGTGVKIAPKLGDGALFYNVDDAGDGHPRSIHASLPVRQGTKWLSTLWIREKVFENR